MIKMTYRRTILLMCLFFAISAGVCLSGQIAHAEELIIDNYNDTNPNANSLGFWTGGNAAMLETLENSFDGTRCRRFRYQNSNWYASNVWNDITHRDITDYQFLSFAIRGVSGGESMKLELQYGVSAISSVNFSGTQTEWQEVDIPLSSFIGLDKTRMRSVSIVFQGSGTIYLDNLKFTSGEVVPPPPPPQKPESTGPVVIKKAEKKLYVDGEPFVIKGVGYQPTPVGSYPLPPDSRGIYERDFPLLTDMGCNTIRIWGLPFSPKYYNLIEKARKYGLKVIAGFWLEKVDFTSQSVRSNIERDFRNFINAYKNDGDVILMWALGNEISYAFDEIASRYGRNKTDVANEFYKLCNRLAEIAYEIEGDSYHPVMIVNGHLYYIGESEFGGHDEQLNFIDVWGTNAYSRDFTNIVWHERQGSYFEFYKERSEKPLVVTEYGADAYRTSSSPRDPGGEDEDAQAEWVSANTEQIMSAQDVCLGGSIMAYSDEWWKYQEENWSEAERLEHAGIHEIGPATDWGDNLPDGHANEEYWGIMRIERDGAAYLGHPWNRAGDGLDEIEPRKVYYRLKELLTESIADINRDGKIDLLDLAELSKSWLASQGDPNYNPNADLDNNGRVDLADYELFAAEWQPEPPPPPENLTAQVTSPNQVTLNWKNISDVTDTIIVLDGYIEIDRIGGDNQSYVHENAGAGTHDYVLQAHNSVVAVNFPEYATSVFSNVASVVVEGVAEPPSAFFIPEGEEFAPVVLADYVDIAGAIEWTSSGNIELDVFIDSGRAIVTYPAGWKGSETITFTASRALESASIQLTFAVGEDSEEIRQRIDQAYPGEEIKIQAGIYVFTSDLNIAQNVSLVGEGPDTTAFVLNEHHILIKDPEHPYGVRYPFSSNLTEVTIKGITITGHDGANEYGPIENYARELTIENCKLIENKGMKASAIYTSYLSILNIENTLIARNMNIYSNAHMPDENYWNNTCYSGTIYLSGRATVNIINSTIADNTIEAEYFIAGGREIKVSYGAIHRSLLNRVNITDSIIWNNGSEASPSDFSHLLGLFQERNISYSNVQQLDIPGKGAVEEVTSVDPQFAEREKGDYSLSATSPLRSTGRDGYMGARFPVPAEDTPAPLADFTAAPTSGDAPLTVQFTNASTPDDGTLTYEWYFENGGRGGRSSEKNPFYTFELPGTWTVALRVRGPDGENLNMKQAYITVTPPDSQSGYGDGDGGDTGGDYIDSGDIISGELRARLDNAGDGDEFKVLIRMKDSDTIASYLLTGLENSRDPAMIIGIKRLLARASQEGMIRKLQSAVADGRVREYKKYWAVNMVSCTATKELIEELNLRPDVLGIYEDKVVPAPEPLTSGEIDMGSAVTDSLTWGLKRIDAPALWQLGYDGSGIIIGSIDTGVYAEHPDLIGKMADTGDGSIGWFDAVGGSEVPADDIGHGTHTIGTMVGGSNNESRITTGVAPGAKYYSARIFMMGKGTLRSDILAAAEWMMDPDGNPSTDDFPDIINNSWGTTEPGSNDEWFRDMVRGWRKIGIIPVFAAGNLGRAGTGSVSDPGNYPESFSVGATDIADEVTDFSSRGPAYYDNQEIIRPDIVAPGAYVISALARGSFYDRDFMYSQTKIGADLAWMNGTSMAAPHVAGICALIKQKYPNYSVDDIINLLSSTAYDLGDSANLQGSGRVELTEISDAKAIFEPRFLYLGEVDKSERIWTYEKDFAINNLTGETRSYTISIKDRLPLGLTAEISPSEVTLGPNASATLLLSVAVDNDILPDVNGGLSVYEFEFTAQAPDDVTSGYFSFKKATTLELTFDEPFDKVYVHNRRGSVMQFTGRGETELKVELPENGIYDLVITFGQFSSYVIKEGIDPSATPILAVSVNEASHRISLNPKDKDGEPLPPETGIHLLGITHKDSKQSFGVEASGGQKKDYFISDLSDSYILVWRETNRAESGFYGLNDVHRGGVQGDVIFGNEPGDLKHVEIKYNNLSVYDTLYVRDTYGGTWFYRMKNPPLTDPFIMDYYFMPDSASEHVNIFESTVYLDESLSMFYELYSLPYLNVAGQGTIRFQELVPDAGFETLFETDSDKLFFGFGPPHFSGVMDNSEALISLDSSHNKLWNLDKSLYLNQMYDVGRTDRVDYELYRDESLIDSGSLDLWALKSWEVPSEPARYKAVLKNKYTLAGSGGEGITTLEFNTGDVVDKNPPLLTRLQILSDGDITDSLKANGDNVIKFKVQDDGGSVQSRLYYRISGGDWVELSLEAADGEYVSPISLPNAGFVALKIEAVDSVGNVLTYELHPAFRIGENTAVNQRPVAKIESITPVPVIRGGSATLKGTATDADGTIDEYVWYVKALTRPIWSGSEVTVDNLPETGLVYFKAKDNYGVWSEEDVRILWVVDEIGIRRPDRLEALPGMTGLDLKWGYNGETPREVSGYRIYFGKSLREVYNSYRYGTDFIDAGDVNEYILTDVEPNTEYYVAVSAYGMISGEQKESILSEIVNFTTRDGPPAPISIIRPARNEIFNRGGAEFIPVNGVISVAVDEVFLMFFDLSDPSSPYYEAEAPVRWGRSSGTFEAQIPIGLLPVGRCELVVWAEGDIRAGVQFEIKDDGQSGYGETGYGQTGYGEYVPNEILVKFTQEIADILAQLIEQHGYVPANASLSPSLDALNAKYQVRNIIPVIQRGRYAPRNQITRIYKLVLGEGQPADAAKADYDKDPGVEYAQPNYIYQISMVPNDPYYHSSGSWGQSYDDLWGLKKLECEKAWDISQGEGVVVAVIDTGVDYNHEDLAENIWVNENEIPGNGIDDDDNGYIDDVRGWNFVNKDNNPMDEEGHGTHVAGTIAAVGNNGVGIIGVAPKAKIMVAKGLGNAGGTTEDLAKCITYAADNGANVLSNSWRGGGITDKVMGESIDHAYNQGCVIVFAAGNENADVAYFTPANHPKTIAVAATDYQDQKAAFSNWGNKIDVAAPGVEILSLRAKGTDIYLGEEGYTSGERFVPQFDDNAMYYRASGTSMACPHVAGVAALVLSNHPEFNNEQVRQVLRVSAYSASSSGWDINFGYGRVNAKAALQINSAGIAKITSPSSYDTVKGIIEIKGIITGTTYKLEYGFGITPDGWTELGGGSLEDGILARWDTSLVPNGDYTLRLTIAGGFVDRILVTVDNISIVSPQEGELFNTKAELLIKGTVVGTNFKNYIVEYKREDSPVWLSEGVTLTNGGNAPVEEDVLARWDITNITSPGNYDIRLTVNSTGLIRYKLRKICLDPRLHNGWPIKKIGIGMGPLEAVQCHPAIYDFDKDGKQEIVIVTTYRTLIYNSEGILLRSWEGGKNAFTSGGFTAGVSIGDIDNDGIAEIVVGEWHGISVYWFDGKVKRLTLQPTDDFAGNVVLSDIDNDGLLEMIYCVTRWAERKGSAVLCVIKYSIENDDFVPGGGWPQEISDDELTCFGSSHLLTVGDVDNDGEPEIITSVQKGPPSDSGLIWWWRHDMYIFNKSGTIEQYFQEPDYDRLVYDPGFILTDLNMDGDLEIGFAFRDDRGIEYLKFIHHNGADVEGWPYTYENDIFSNNVESSIASDINQDGIPEIISWRSNILADDSGMLFVLDSSGNKLGDNWPLRINNSLVDMVPVIGDINGDGFPDLIIPAGASFAQSSTKRAVYFFDGAGRQIEEPLIIPDAGLGQNVLIPGDAGQSAVGAAIGDVDNDGKVEIVVLTADYYNKGMVGVWDLEGKYDPSTMEWPTYRHDNYLTACYTPLYSGTALVANFTATPTSGPVPLTVQFTDESTGDITDRRWDFGDGESGYGQTGYGNITTHTYNTAGTYTVSLTVTGPGGSDTETKANYITVVTPPPQAAFTADITRGEAPLTVQFTNLSTPDDGTLTYEWYFENGGRGGRSSEKNPSYRFELPGTYTVTLVATGPGGNDVEVKNDYITVLPPPPIAAFRATPTSGEVPLTVQFTDESTGDITDRRWDFGDGESGYGQTGYGNITTHTYNNAGAYTVSLTVTGPGGSDIETKENYINVTQPNRPPVAFRQEISLVENSSIDITLEGDDPDGDFLTYIIVVRPIHGTLSGRAPILTYTPYADYDGQDAFAFIVNDGEYGSRIAAVFITVTPLVDAWDFERLKQEIATEDYLEVPPGTYVFTSDLEITKNITIIGENAETTIFELGEHYILIKDPEHEYSARSLFSDNLTDVIIEGITIKGHRVDDTQTGYGVIDKTKFTYVWPAYSDHDENYSGPILNYAAKLILSNCKIVDNEGVKGSTIFTTRDSELYIDNSYISGNVNRLLENTITEDEIIFGDTYYCGTIFLGGLSYLYLDNTQIVENTYDREYVNVQTGYGAQSGYGTIRAKVEYEPIYRGFYDTVEISDDSVIER